MFFASLYSNATRLASLCFLCIVIGRAALAIEPATPLERLGRQAWTMENGLPQNSVPVLLQSRDGFLWAGTELGLARFDGVNLLAFDHTTSATLPDAEIRCLLDAGPGNLWIGTSDGLVHRQSGDNTLFTTANGLPSNSILGLAQTTDGTVFVWTESGLAQQTQQAGKSFQPVSMPRGVITSIAVDSTGGLWIATAHGAALYRSGQWLPGPGSVGVNAQSDGPARVKTLANGDVLIATGNGVYLNHSGTPFTVLPKSALPADGIDFLDRLSNGTIAIASKSTLVLARVGETGPLVTVRLSVTRNLPGTRIESLYADREGRLWIGTNHGLARIAFGTDGSHTPAIELLPLTDPLSSTAVVSLLEDREGDLWVGTETAGLHILRDARFHGIGLSDGLTADATTAVVQDTNKTLWVGTRDSGLNRVVASPDGKLTIASLTTANGLLSNVILSLAASPDGSLWVGTPDGLNRIGHGATASYTSADGLPDDFIRSVLVAPDSSVWIGTRRGLSHLDPTRSGPTSSGPARMTTLTQSDGLGSNLVGAIALAANGDLWIATLNGLSRLRQGRLQNFTTADGLSSNIITALDFTPDGNLWIGTQGQGLNLWNGQRFAAIGSSLLPRVIHEVIHDTSGHLWIGSDSGLTRVDIPALSALVACTGQSVTCAISPGSVLTFTTADGLRSRETSSNSHPTATRAADGTLWFTTPRGVLVADPLHFPAVLPPPPVAIERFAVDDRDLPNASASRITAGALRFQFDYAGLSFAAPQKLRYRYMLEGFDHTWTDAGSRRTAYYTNIPPGSYRFRVRAALSDAALQTPSDDPSYAPQEAALSFELQPHFYQTIWFRALVLLALAALVILVFRRRVLRVEREFRAVMGERNRIAREIHDTLAQGYVGIQLQLQLLGELLRYNRIEAAAKHLALTQDLVREGLDDARQSIWALRSQDAGEQTLPIRLRRIVEKAGTASLAADLEVYGAYRALDPDAEQEILRIAQEAIQNVKKHAAASRLNVRLDYDERSLTLSVKDDGKGFPIGETPKGHYGLTGMRERAALIHGEIEIVSQPGQGATIRLRVAAPVARNSQAAAVLPTIEIDHEESTVPRD